MRNTVRFWQATPLRFAIIGTLLLMSVVTSVTLTLQHAYAADATITINKNIQYQQMDGFGAFGGKQPWFTGGPYTDDAFVHTVVDDLGLTIVRDEVPPHFEQTPGVFDVNASPTDTCQGQSVALSNHFPYLQALKAEADAKGEPLKMIASVWSPPSWMKYVHCVFGGDTTWNRLIVSEIPSAENPNDRKADYAQFLVKYIQAIKQNTGIDLYAISIQNEPVFGQGYPSAVYSPEVLKNVIKVVGQAFHDNGITTKIFMPEDVTDLSRMTAFVQWAENDPIARQYVDIIAVHGYGPDGVTNSGSQQFWSGLHDVVAHYDQPLWQTETSGYTNDWTGGMNLAGSIYTAIKYGHVSGWVWWSLSETGATQYSLMNNGQPTALYYASKQYYRYVRPGAVLIDSNSSDSDVLVNSFNNVQSKTLTSVLINKGSSAKTVSLNFQGGNIPSQFSIVRSSSSENAVSVGTMSSSDSLTLPANSVTTIYGTSANQDALQAPSILTQPQNTSVNDGQSVTFSVNATGSPTVKYQWQRNGSDIPGATGSLYTFTASSNDNNAQYTVKITNGQGSVTSNAATLSVGAFSGAQIAPASGTINIDGNANDAIWSSAQSYNLGNTTGSPSGLSVSYQSAWDNNNLYFLVKVNDATYATGSDNVEIYIDGDNAKSGGYYDANDVQYLFTWGSTTVSQYAGGQSGTRTSGIQFKQVASGNGYQVEVSIPWSNIGVSPTAGNNIGLDLDVAQQSTPGTTSGKVFWNATSDDDWHDPSKFGVAKISTGGDPNPTPTPTPTTTPTPTATPTPTPGSWTLCANEGGTCTFSGTHQVRYGANGTYAYQTATGSISCTNAVFGDPTPGVAKHCDVSSDTATATPTPTPTATSTPTPTSTATTWTKCADEGGTCTFSGTHQVRYGANGTYNYQTATGSISCTNNVFGDPTPGVVKACYYS